MHLLLYLILLTLDNLYDKVRERHVSPVTPSSDDHLRSVKRDWSGYIQSLF